MTHRIVLVAMLAVLVLLPGRASAQSERPGMEVGAHFESLHIKDAGTISTGAGGRLSVDLSRWVAVEGELTFFPKDQYKLTSAINGEAVGLIYNRRRIEGLFGVKAGLRGPRVGVFGRVRPGFTRLTDSGVDCLQVCALILIAPPEYKNEFAFDLGATLELYWTPRALMRIDVGDTLIRYDADPATPETSGTVHNLATRIGVGFRF